MMDVIANSPSIIMRSPHILYVRVGRAEPGEWKEVGEQTFQRAVEVEFEILEDFKAAEPLKKPKTASVSVTQFESRAILTTGVPGAWSACGLDRGAEFVAFCRAGRSLADALVEPERVDSADSSLADVRLAHESETEALPLEKLLQRAANFAPFLEQPFSEYLWARHGATAMGHEPGAESLMTYFTRPDLTNAGRYALQSAIVDDLGAVSNVPHWFTRRFALALFRIAELPEAAMLRDNVLDVYLPNVLGVVGGGEKFSARAIFGEDAARRREVEALLRGRPGPGSDRLLAWIAE